MSRIRLKHARYKIKARRDDAGVPHIEASNWLEALYGLGYLHALDRPTQLTFARAVASGCAAEHIADKPELLETDCFFRRVGLHLDLDEQLNDIDDDIFRQIEIYCAGVNDGLAQSGRTLAMRAVGFQPRTWHPSSVLLVGKLLSFGGLAVGQMQNERLLLELIHDGASEEGIKELFAPRMDNIDFELIRQVKMSSKLSSDALELLTDLPRLAGSNAWAVAPCRSATGSALLASDPHLEVNRLPAIWYEAVLRWGDGQYVMGASLPGCPLFAVARTERIAWGVTYMKGDTIDYFIEDCRKGGATGWQYRRGRQWHDFQLRRETVVRKGVGTRTLRIYENEQGVIDSDLDALGPGYHLSLNWTGRTGPSWRAIAAWLNLIASQSTKEAMDVARECPQPTLNFVLADVEGHIGLQGCGTFPRRHKKNIGLGAIPAWIARNHWNGTLSTDLLPSIFDPPEGYVATANEEYNPPGTLQLVTQTLPDYRVRRIRERLDEMPKATIRDMQSIQYDLVSLHARDLLPHLLPHLPDGEMKERLAQWDCRYDTESREAALFQRFYFELIIEVFGRHSEIGWRRAFYLCTRTGLSMMILTAADRILQKEDSWWWRGREKGDFIRRAARRAGRVANQRWADVNRFHFTDRFFGSHKVGRLLGFSGRQWPMPGNHATPFQGHVLQTATRESTFAPSYHFVTDMGTDQAWTNLPGGPSESRFSRYYKSGVPLWLEGEYKLLKVE